jgi:orotidine-5'-phosphate decarboxylase
MTSRTNQAYGGRATDHPNRLSRRLFEIAESKKTNITLSADVTTTEELLDIADSMMALFIGARLAGLVRC